MSNNLSILGSSRSFTLPKFFSAADEFNIPDPAQKQFFERAGLKTFDDFWQLPRDFIEDINYRRCGQSAASKLDLDDGDEGQVFYVNRQENQKRYSLFFPFGELTYRFELTSTNRNKALELPPVDIVCFGFRHQNGHPQGLIITRKIPFQALSEIYESGGDWQILLPVLLTIGKILHKMNRN